MDHITWWQTWQDRIQQAHLEYEPWKREFYCRAAVLANMEYMCRSAIYWMEVRVP